MILETEILSAVIEYLNGECEDRESLPDFSPIVIGGTVAGKSGISAELAPGYTRTTYLDNGVLQRMAVLLIIRDQRRQKALETAFTIAEVVRNSARLESPVHESVVSVNMGSGPEFVDRNGADYIYSLIFNIDYMTN